MEGIYNANDDFPFSNLVLIKPTSISGGNYFIKFRINDTPLYIQTPKCNTKNGILKAGKKYFSDLMFTNEHETFIQWIEKLENYCQKYIYDNRKYWFDTELEMHDIENSFSSCFKLYKSGKYYIVRSCVPTQLGLCSLKIYNEDEELIDHTEITDKHDIITILEVQGIKCSARSFQIEIEIKQMLVLRQTNLFEKCILSSGHNKYQPSSVDGKSSNTFPGGHLSEREHEFHMGKLPIPEILPVSEIATKSEAYSNLSADTDLGKQNNKMKMSLELSPNTTPPISLEFGETLKDNSTIPVRVFNQDNISPMNDHTNMTIPETESNIETDNMENADNNGSDELTEIEFTLDEIPETDQIQIKTRNDVYYKMYQDAKQKAKMAKALALSSYLEAQRIKNTYMLEDLDDSDSDSDLDEDTFT